MEGSEQLRRGGARLRRLRCDGREVGEEVRVGLHAAQSSQGRVRCRSRADKPSLTSIVQGVRNAGRVPGTRRTAWTDAALVRARFCTRKGRQTRFPLEVLCWRFLGDPVKSYRLLLPIAAQLVAALPGKQRQSHSGRDASPTDGRRRSGH